MEDPPISPWFKTTKTFEIFTSRCVRNAPLRLPVKNKTCVRWYTNGSWICIVGRSGGGRGCCGGGSGGVG